MRMAWAYRCAILWRPLAGRSTGFHGGSASPHGRYKNLISYAWHEVAQKVRKHQIIVPADQKLIAQLSSRRVKYAQDGRLWIETKQEMRDRGLESPDLADAFVMAFGMEPARSYSWTPFDDSNRQEIARRHGCGNWAALLITTTRATKIGGPGTGRRHRMKAQEARRASEVSGRSGDDAHETIIQTWPTGLPCAFRAWDNNPGMGRLARRG